MYVHTWYIQFQKPKHLCYSLELLVPYMATTKKGFQMREEEEENDAYRRVKLYTDYHEKRETDLLESLDGKEMGYSGIS